MHKSAGLLCGSVHCRRKPNLCARPPAPSHKSPVSSGNWHNNDGRSRCATTTMVAGATVRPATGVHKLRSFLRSNQASPCHLTGLEGGHVRVRQRRCVPVAAPRETMWRRRGSHRKARVHALTITYKAARGHTQKVAVERSRIQPTTYKSDSVRVGNSHWMKPADVRHNSNAGQDLP
jgi:hypothetical protein